MPWRPFPGEKGLHMPPTDVSAFPRPTGPSATPGAVRRPVRAPQAVRHGLSAEQRAGRVRMRRAVTLLLMTLVLPGSAQVAAGNRRVGRVVLRVWLGLLATGVVVAVVGRLWPMLLVDVALGPTTLALLRVVLIALAIGWAALFADAWRLADPLALRRNQRIALVTLNGLLCFSVVGGLLFSAHVVNAGREVVVAVFAGDEVTEPTHGRYNVLLVGADAGEGRVGLRTDSMTVASIDQETGEAVLISLPRNLQKFPFSPGSVMDREFPDGFDCDGCYLNGVSTWATDHPDLFGSSTGASDDELFQLGMDATVSAVEGVTDLAVNYWALVDMRGFDTLIDAVGGVELNVRSRIPIGGVGSPIYGYIEPGVQTLDGYHALWFARSRADSDDYSRMARQKCVMAAIADQLEPSTLVTKFGEIAQAGAAMLETNIPASEIDVFADLAIKARSHPISSVSIVPPAVDTADPDMDVVHDMIADAISGTTADDAPVVTEEAAAPAGAPSAPSGGADAGQQAAAEETVTGGSVGSRDEGYAANKSTDLDSAC